MSDVKELQEKAAPRFKDYPLDNSIKRGLSELGFKKPLEVQAEVIPMILEGKDLIVKSQTGSGKTAAFAIPICQNINTELESPQALILSPTRELTDQIKQDILDIGKYKEIKCCALYGKQLMELQRRELKGNTPHVIVATPGRMMDHILNKNVKLGDIKYLVIDEADEMLIMGFKDQLEAIIKRLPKERVTLLFSATIPDEVKFLCQEFMNQAESIEIEAKEPALEKIKQVYYAVDGLKKVDLIKKVIQKECPRKAIMFCNTQEQVTNLFEIFRKWGNFTCAVHGGMDQQMRTEKLNAFKRGEYRMLIATDIAARGLHIQDVSHIINYSVPFEHEQYVHRIGRTGRVDQRGIAITMVIPSEMDRFNELQTFLGYNIICKGGNQSKNTKSAPSLKNVREKSGAFDRRMRPAVIQFNVGSHNSTLRVTDFLFAIRDLPGIYNEDIGKVEIKPNITKVEMLNGKAPIVIKAFRTRKIKDKLCRVKMSR